MATPSWEKRDDADICETALVGEIRASKSAIEAIIGPPSYFSKDAVGEDGTPIDFTTEWRFIVDAEHVAVVYDTDPIDDETNEVIAPAPDEKIIWYVGAQTAATAETVADILGTPLTNKRLEVA